MKESLISDVLLEMKPLIDDIQLKQLETALQKAVTNYEVMETSTSQVEQHADSLESFISAKRVEGCSERTLDYYRRTIEKMQQSIERDSRRITTEELRVYLAKMQNEQTSPRSSAPVCPDGPPATPVSQRMCTIYPGALGATGCQARARSLAEHATANTTEEANDRCRTPDGSTAEYEHSDHNRTTPATRQASALNCNPKLGRPK